MANCSLCATALHKRHTQNFTLGICKTTVTVRAKTTDQSGGTTAHLHNEMQFGSEERELFGPLPPETNPHTTASPSQILMRSPDEHRKY